MNITIDSEKLLPLIKSFYELSGMKIAIYDNDFREVLTYPQHSSGFCEAVWECCGRGKCDKFTADMCRKNAGNRETIVYTCHAGLTEVILPLREKETVFGYAVCGQVTNKPDRKIFVDDVLERCKDFGIEQEKLKELLQDIEYWSDSRIEATMQIINALASYIILQKMVYISEKPPGFQICEYIKENVASDLSVAALCKRFAMSKSKLYTVTDEYMPEGIAKFVRKCRLEAAMADISKNPAKPLWKVAQDVGFGNYEYFLRVFKAETGKSAKSRICMENHGEKGEKI